jgi:hypothetical protein
MRNGPSVQYGDIVPRKRKPRKRQTPAARALGNSAGVLRASDSTTCAMRSLLT